MKAVVLRDHGGPEVLQFEDVPTPVFGAEEILVTVAATALNRADLLQRLGFYPNPFPSGPEIPGLEFAGTVAAVGERVTAWKVGDHVMGITSGGAYAEQLVTIASIKRATRHQQTLSLLFMHGLVGSSTEASSITMQSSVNSQRSLSKCVLSASRPAR